MARVFFAGAAADAGTDSSSADAGGASAMDSVLVATAVVAASFVFRFRPVELIP